MIETNVDGEARHLAIIKCTSLRSSKGVWLSEILHPKCYCNKFITTKSIASSSNVNDIEPGTSIFPSIDPDDNLRQLNIILRFVVNTIVKVLAEVGEESKQLKSIFIAKQFKGWEHSVRLGNRRKIIINILTLTDSHCVLHAVFTEVIWENTASKYHIGSRSSISRAK